MIKRIFSDWMFFIFIFIIVLVVFLYYKKLYFTDANIAPTLVALTVGLLSRIYSIYENKQLAECKNTKIKRVLIDRDDKNEYGEKIASVKGSLYIMGHTAKRLLEDFADFDSAREDKKQLIRALERGVNVKILIAGKDYLGQTKQADFDTVLNGLKKLKELSTKYKGLLEYRYYQHSPSHSIFKFDDECFLGPIFEEIESQHTPVIHSANSSEYATKYLKHFDKEWEKAVCK